MQPHEPRRGIASPVNGPQWQKGKVIGDRHRVAEQEFVAAEALFRQAGDPRGLAAAQGNHAVIPGCRGELDQALALMEKAKALWKNLGDKSNWERLLINKGLVLAKLGQPGRTTACLRRAGKLLRRGCNWPALAVSLTTLASFYSERGKTGWPARPLTGREVVRDGFGKRDLLARLYGDQAARMLGIGLLAEAEALAQKAQLPGVGCKLANCRLVLDDLKRRCGEAVSP